MPPRRRSTDRPPFSEMVSRGNLDDRLVNVDNRFIANERLDAERWVSHKDQHLELARNLSDYKRESNEWRKTLLDLRDQFLLKSEFSSEARRLEGLHTGLDSRLDAIERAVQSINEREVVTRSVLSSGRNLIILAFTIIGGLIGVALYLRPAP